MVPRQESCKYRRASMQGGLAHETEKAGRVAHTVPPPPPLSAVLLYPFSPGKSRRPETKKSVALLASDAKTHPVRGALAGFHHTQKAAWR